MPIDQATGHRPQANRCGATHHPPVPPLTSATTQTRRTKNQGAPTLPGTLGLLVPACQCQPCQLVKFSPATPARLLSPVVLGLFPSCGCSLPRPCLACTACCRHPLSASAAQSKFIHQALHYPGPDRATHLQHQHQHHSPPPSNDETPTPRRLTTHAAHEPPPALAHSYALRSNGQLPGCRLIPLARPCFNPPLFSSRPPPPFFHRHGHRQCHRRHGHCARG